MKRDDEEFYGAWVIAGAVLFASLILLAGRSHDRKAFASGQTPAYTCGAGQFVNSQVVNTGQSCGAPAVDYLKGTSAVITGTLLAAGGFDSGTATVSGATAGMSCGGVTTTDGTPMNSYILSCTVTGSGANNVTIAIASPVIGTPPSKSYRFTVWP